MRLEKYRDGDVVILKFTGEFDTFNLPAFSERIDRMIDGGDEKFVFDLRLLKFINSAALGYLIKTSKRLQSAGGELVLSRPSNFLKKTLATLGLDDVFKMFESVEAGVQHLRTGEDVGEIQLEGGEYDEALTGSVPILFRPSGSDDANALPTQVGSIVTLYEDGLLFRYEPDPDKGDDPVEKFLNAGQTLKLRFRQPFAVLDYYFEMSGRIVDVSLTRAGESLGIFFVKVLFDDIKPADRELLRPFRGGGGTSGSGGVPARLKPGPSGDSGHARPERSAPDDRT